MKTSIIHIALIALVVASCSEHETHEYQTAHYRATTPVREDTTIFKEYVCQIRSIRHIELRVLEEGYLESVMVDEGQHVSKGTLMFRIMPMVYQAEMQKAKAEADFARIEYENTRSLADSNIVSKNEVALAKARYDKALAELALAETKLKFTEIRAPFDGVVGRFNDVRTGSLLEDGELLTTLSDNSKMWVYFNVPEAEYLDYMKKNLLEGEKPRVYVKLANGDIFEHAGVVETIEADFNNETGNIAFRATFENPDGILRHGQTGKILLPTTLEDAILIPQEATFDVLNKKFVFTVANGLVTTREITTGVEMQHTFEVLDGLQTSDTILVEGLRKVKNGDHISVDYIPQRELLDELFNLHAE